MKPGKDIYNQLPHWVQDLGVNIASRRNFAKKYGGVFQGWLNDLEHNERKSRDESMHQQQVAVRHLLEYALEHVPYYRDLKLPPDDFNAWPILDRAAINAQPESFLSDEFVPGDLLQLRTSGTTGTPLTVHFSKEYHQIEMAFRWRHKAWAGVPFLSSSAYVSGHPVVPPNQTKPPFWHWDRYEKRLLCSSYHLAPQNLPHYIAAFVKYAPDFIHGYPSSMFVLAQYLLEHKITNVRPRAVFTASETLLDFQRTAIQQAFGAHVFNWYGNTEMTCNIVECTTGNLHYRTDYGHLELLEDGTMVVTGLNNRAMPLIRYRIGDFATAKPGDCPCGCAFPLIERIEGRAEDYVRTPDGRLLGRLDHLFKDATRVREAQLIQRSFDELVLRIVRAPGFGQADERRLRDAARQRLSDSMRIRFEFVDSIERTASGKFRFIISELPPDTFLRATTSSTEPQVREMFNKHAEAWGRMYQPNQKMAWRLDEFHRSLQQRIPPPARVLDFGSGTGNLAKHLHDHGYLITACDIAEKMIAEARRTCAGTNIEFVNLPIGWRQLPFPDGTFDGVVASSVFEYVDDCELVFREMARVLRPGGVLVFSVPNPRHRKRKLENCVARLMSIRPICRVAGTVERVRKNIQYLELSKNRFPVSQWEQLATQPGLHSLQSAIIPTANRPLLLLSFQKSQA